MAKQLTAQEIKKAILAWPGLYQTPSGAKFRGMPVSQVPGQLVSCGWRNVSHLDQHDLKKLGLVIVEARYGRRARQAVL